MEPMGPIGPMGTLWPMGPMGPMGRMGPMCPMGPMAVTTREQQNKHIQKKFGNSQEEAYIHICLWRIQQYQIQSPVPDPGTIARKAGNEQCIYINI